MLITILATVVVLGVLIFVHELGHFVTAKLVDIEVPRFSIGLGPKLIGFRRGETEYVISWLPLGGYVKMAGMEEMEAIEGGSAKREESTGIAGASDMGLLRESDGRAAPRPRDFESKSLPARAMVISAGVLMNFLFAIVVFAASALIWGIELDPEARMPALDASELPAGTEALASVPPGVRVVAFDGEPIEDWGDLRMAVLTASAGPKVVEFDGAPPVTIDVPANDTAKALLVAHLGPVYPPVIGDVLEGQPAAEAGIRAGDRVISAGGKPVRDWRELVSTIQAHPDLPLDLEIERDGARLTIRVVPASQTVEGPDGPRVIGVIGALPMVEHERPGVLGAVGHGFARTGEVIALIVGFLGDLFTGDASPRSLGGPILIGQLSGQVARLGLQAFLDFMALFSVNLAVLNLLPIPVLDGGHLVFLAIEAIRGRALSFEQRVRFTQVGFVIVLAIMVWALANDFLRLFGL